MNRRFYALLLIITTFLMVLSGCSNASETAKTSTNTIGIIGAMEEEVEILKGKMDIEKEVEKAGITFYKGKLDDQNIVIARSGVGKVNAALCTQLMIDLFNIDYLVNSGVAGGMNKELKQGDIVISTDAVQHDFDVTALGEPLGEISRLGVTYFKADDKLINLCEKASKEINLEKSNVVKGRIASGDQFIAGGDLEEKIRTNFDPFAVEMEGAAIAHVAYLNEIPYVIIRAVSDNADGKAELSYPEFLPIAAKNASLLLEEIIKLSGQEL